jgi:RNA polymerase sigma-70 factor, ECF subfamily
VGRDPVPAVPFVAAPCRRMDLASSLNSGMPWADSNCAMYISHALRRGTSNAGPCCKLTAIPARFPIVSASNHEHRDVEPAGTLGDLLYADPAKPRVLESEWRELVAAVAARDQLALRALYDRSHRLVFTLTVRILGNHASAEEVTLDVFHDVWRRASSYDGTGGSVLGWIMNQARSRAIDRQRFETRKKRTPTGVDDPQVAALTTEAAGEDTEQTQALQRALEALTPDERQAIEAAYFSEFTYVEVAQRLNQPLGTIKTRIRSALGKLRRALSTGVNTR